MQRLRSTLDRIDRKGYGAYKDLQGSYDLREFDLFVDRVQRDPFAPPSLVRVRTKDNRFEPVLFENPVRRVAFEDFLTRQVETALRHAVKGNRGSGGSGRIEIQRASQVVLPRTSVLVESNFVEARMGVGLPARGRTVDARAAQTMLLEELPRVVREALTPAGMDPEAAHLHVEVVEDADHLRKRLPTLGLVAFVADGAMLPRESGASDRPLREGAVPLESPEEFRVTVELPNRGEVSGMSIPEGVTLVAGGGFHGKSTLLSALSLGIYDHVPGDGRELVVARADAVKIRAEDGRSVAGVDISGMIGELPGGRPTTSFSTTNASGSTSQAANIAEAVEIGTSLLLVDEDTSATNFMIRDERMRELVRKEPISPFIDLVRGRRETARGRGLYTIELGRERVDLSYLEQLAEAGQTEAIARSIGEFAAGNASREVTEVVNGALGSIRESGLDSLGNFRGHPGELSLPRPQEVAAAINRIRSLEATTET